MNSQDLENPAAVPQSGPPKLATTTQTYLTTPGAPFVTFKGTSTVHTTSTYLSPPWTWSTIRQTPPDQIVPLAALAVILAALVAIAGMLVMVAVVLLKVL